MLCFVFSERGLEDGRYHGASPRVLKKLLSEQSTEPVSSPQASGFIPHPRGKIFVDIGAIASRLTSELPMVVSYNNYLALKEYEAGDIGA